MSQIQRVQIRQPATANLMVDSADRNTGTWGNFTINRTNSILNGFFHRIGVTEMVLEWNEPNILAGANNTITITVASVNYTATLEEAFYTVDEAFQSLCDALNTLNIPTIAATWVANRTSLPQFEGAYYFGNTAGISFTVVPTSLSAELDLDGAGNVSLIRIERPDLRPYRYIDIVSPSLTYNQKLKDASTAPDVRDVLVRWYFAWDDTPQVDAGGWPILMGYTAFCARRIFSPPKQIRWENNMPVGQIKFEVYDDAGFLINTNDNVQFLMTLQACED